MKTKYLLSLLFNICLIAINAQTKVSINNTTVNISPSYTVNNGTAISITGQVKNVGATTITGNVHVNVAIDTSSTGTPKYFKRSTKTTPVVGFAPNAIFSFTATDVVDSGNGYKIAGNGTTIVIWSVVGLSTDTTTALDSVFTNVYVIDVTDIKDWSDFENQNIIIQNPAIEILNVKLKMLNEPITIDLINENGIVLNSKIAEPLIQHLSFNIQNLTNGLYYLNFYNKEKIKIGAKKVIIQ